MDIAHCPTTNWRCYLSHLRNMLRRLLQSITPLALPCLCIKTVVLVFRFILFCFVLFYLVFVFVFFYLFFIFFLEGGGGGGEGGIPFAFHVAYSAKDINRSKKACTALHFSNFSFVYKKSIVELYTMDKQAAIADTAVGLAPYFRKDDSFIFSISALHIFPRFQRILCSMSANSES